MKTHHNDKSYLVSLLLILSTLAVISHQTPVKQTPATITFVSTSQSSQSDALRHGSLLGTNLLYFSGSGLVPSLSALSVTIDGVDCPIDLSFTSNTWTACKAPAGSAGQKAVVLSVNGVKANCPDTICYYVYDLANTAIYEYIVPNYMVANRGVRIGGITRATKSSALDLKISQYACPFGPYGDQALTPDSTSFAECKLGNIPSGYYTTTLKTNTIGTAMKKTALASISDAGSDNSLYELLVVPEITSQSANSGPSTGTQIMIKGTGFSVTPEENQVMLEGQVCTVKTSSPSHVMCILKDTVASSLPAGTLRPGHGGLTQRIFPIQSLATLKTSSAFLNGGGTQVKLPSFEIPYNDLADYTHALEGFYKATVTGDHVFYLAANGPAELYISTTALSNSNLQKIAYITSGSGFRDYYTPSETNQKSAAIYLEQDKYYYIRAIHVAQGVEHLTVGVSIPNTQPTTLNQAEVVSVNLNADVTRLEVIATITNSTSTLQVYLLPASGTTPLKSRTFTYATSAANIVGALADVGIEAIILSTTYLDKSGNVVAPAQATKTQYRLRFYTDPVLKNMPGFNQANLGGFAKAVDNNPTALVSGTYTIAFGTKQITLNFDATYDIIETALNTAFGTQGAFKVYLYGRPEEGVEYVIYFDRTLGDIPAGVVVANGLTGGASGVNIGFNALQDYSTNILVSPIAPSFLYSAETSPQLTVTTNGLRALCSTNCGYNSVVVTSAQTTVIGFSWTDLILTIDFVNADTKTLNKFTDVWFAGNSVSCSSYDNSIQRLTCNMVQNPDSTPQVVAGSFVPEVYISGEGYASTATGVTPVSIAPVVNSITTSSISTGFLQFALTGANYGFQLSGGQNYGTKVVIGGVNCVLQTLSNTQLTCNAQLVVTSGPLVITVNKVGLTVPFDNQTPDIVVEPADDDCYLDIKGTFTDSTTISLVNTQTKVSNTCRSCLRNSTFVRCQTCGLAPGSYNAVATTFTAPKTYKSSTYPFTIKFNIDSISPQIGSQLGGTVVTITGWGFSNTLNENQVAIGCKDGCATLRCNVIESSLTQLKCVTQPNTVGLVGPQDLQAFINLEFGSSCTSGNCNFQFSDSYTPQIYSAAPLTVKAGDQLTLTGALLSSSSVITIDGLVAPIVSATSSQLVVQVPNIQAQSALSFTASDTIYGNYLVDPSVVLNSKVIVTDVSPKTGSKAGAILTITGSGFSSTATVTVGTVACTVIQLTASQIICQAGASSSGVVTVTQGSFTGTCANAADCTFAFDATNLTPAITDVTTSTTAGVFQITIKGSKLNVASPLAINLVSAGITQTTTIVSASASQIIVSIANPIPGTYTLDARIGTNLPQYSKATLVNINIPFAQTAGTIPTTTVSQAGGSDFTLVFDSITLPQDPSLISVKISGFDCTPSYIGSTNLICTIPPLITPGLRQLAQETWLDGVYISSSTSETPANAFDENTATSFVGAVNDCFVGIDVGRDLQAEITQVQFFPKVGMDVTQLLGGVFEGSNDGINYVVFATLSGNIYSGYNTIPFTSASKPTYRYMRFRRSSAASKCELAEINFKGTLLSSITVSSTSLVSVPNAVVTINGYTVDTITTNIQYSKAVTPTVTSISPKVGTSVGGTVVSISGTGFSTVKTDTTVFIDDTVCAVNTVTSTKITCTTGPLPDISARTSRLTGKIDVKTAGKGSAITAGVHFLYAEKWSDAKTWGCGGLPIEGDSVHIPIGMNLLVDMSPPKLVAVVVEGSLIFNDQNLSFQAEYIMIRNGIMKVGTEDEPIQNKIKIILNGAWDDEQLPIFGNKAIALYEGVIDIHGKTRTQTSTTLAVTANAGATTITVDSIGDWAVGEQIAISSTSLDPTENEVFTIKKISGNVITLNAALAYTHLSETEAITVGGQTQTVAVKALIGLLTRNIVIQGNEADSRETSYGATMLFYDPGTENTVVRIANAEFTYVGQAGYIERYPLNFQNTGNQINSYVVGCSIHKSFNRGIQIKSTQYLTVSKNVFFDIPNEAIYLPDGSEKNNVIEDNAIIQITASLLIFNSWNTPPAISVSNPLNFIRRNRIAGVVNNGFTFTYNTAASGASWSSTICPQGEILGAFEDNSVLSCGATGLFIDTYYPRTFACKGVRSNAADPFAVNRPIQATYKNFVVSRSMNGFQAWNLGSVVLDGFKISDSKSGAIEVRHAINSPINSTQVTNAFLVGNLNLNTGSVSVSGYWGINVPSDDGFTIDTCSFAHFDSSASAVLGCSNCANPWEKTGSRVTFLKSTMFTDVSKRIGFTAPYTHIFRDLDGTLTNAGSSGATVVSNLPHLRIPECTANAAVYSGLVCASTLEIRGLNFWNMAPSYVAGKTMRILRMIEGQAPSTDVNDYTITTYRYPFTGYSCPFATGYPYRIFYDVGLDYDSLKLQTSPLYVPEDYPIHITFNYTEPREEYEVWRYTFLQNAVNITNTTTLWNMYSKTGLTNYNFGDFYNDVDKNALYLAVNGKQVGQPTIYDENDASYLTVTAYRCRWNCPAPVEEVIPTVTRLWSDAAGWGGSVPGDGDYVIIEANEIVTLDINTASLGTLEVRGQLIFSDQVSSLTLTAKIIWVRGKLTAGTTDTPYKNKAIINLTGSIVDEPIVVNFAVDAGTKVLVVTGTLSLVGQQVNTLARLGANANIGDKQLKIVGDLKSWSKGDQIVLAPSGLNPSEYESLTISSIDLVNNLVTVETGCKYFHYGAASTFTTLNSKSVDMRTEVLHMTRNVQIQGSQESSLGARVLVTSEIGDEVVTGVVTMKYVSLSYCGQSGTDRAGITFELAATSTGSSITGCAIQNAVGTAVRFKTANLVTFSNNNIFKTQHYGIHFEDNNVDITISNNVIVGVKPNGRGAIIDLQDYSAAIVIYDSTNAKITISGNIAAGCLFSCFFIRAPTCGMANFFTNNVGHSAQIGLVAYEDLKSCISISSFTAYRTAYGVQSYYRVNQIQASNLLLLDNTLALNLASSADGIRQITVTNSYFAATALKSCPQCYTAEQCSNQAAIGLGAFNNDTRPDKFQFYRSSRDTVLGSSYQFTGNYFENYQDSVFGSASNVPQCEANTVFLASQYAIDFIPYITIATSTIKNVDWNSLANFMGPYPGDWNCGPEVQCTLVLNSLIKDLDGTLSGNAKNPAALVPTYSSITTDSWCNWMAAADVCTQAPYGLLGLKSLDVDKSMMVLDYVTITNSDFTFYNLLNSHRDNNPRQVNDTQKWISIIKTATNYDLTFLRDQPIGLDVEFQGQSTDSVIVKIPYRNSKVVRVINTITGQVASACTAVPPAAPAIQASHPCGTYIYDRSADTVQFKITGESTCRLTIQQTNSLVASIRFDISVEEFFEQGGFAPFIDKVAAVLNIPTYRIRVVGVYSGSTILEFLVDSDAQGVGSNADANTELNGLAKTLQNSVTSGQLNMYGAPVLNYKQSIVYSEEDYGPHKKTTTALSGVKLWLIAGGIPAVVLLIGLFVLYKFKLRAGKRTKRGKSVVKIAPEMPPTPKVEGETPTSKLALGEASERGQFFRESGSESRKHLNSHAGSIGSIGTLDEFMKTNQSRLMTPTGGRKVTPLKTIQEKAKEINDTLGNEVENLE